VAGRSQVTVPPADRLRVLLVSSHPVQYAAPVFRRYADDPRLDVLVAFCSLQGVERAIDPEFDTEVAWDVPLLDGYPWVHIVNRSLRPRVVGSVGLVNPGLWSLVRRGRFDVVVCYGYRAASFWIAAAAARASGARLVLTTDAHTLNPRDGARWKLAMKRWILPRLFGVADGVLAPSTRTARFLAELGVSPGHVFLTPYAVDTTSFAAGAAAADRAAVRKRWGIPSSAPVALFVGKLVPWKRPGDLLEAAGSVEGAHVVFAGEGMLRGALERRARQLGLHHRTRFLGFVNQRALPETYAAADVLVLPSEYEAFGVVVNEAFACGRPAVVSDACGSVGDLVRDGDTGFVVRVGDVRALADRLRSLLDDGLRARLGEAARARIAEWGPHQNAAAFADACLALAGRTPPVAVVGRSA
jgi:glycosyltransferase involved in cell wall biosynthesis